MSLAEAQPISPALVVQVESILYAAGEPASISDIATALETSTQDIELALEELSRQCQTRGVRVQRHGNEAQLVTAPEIAESIQKFLGLEATNRLSTAALETLAIIAYKQPITKPQIEMIRGVNCDGVMKTLELHNLIKELGRTDTVGHPMRYGISFEFLQHFGLRDVHELPPVDKLDVLPTGEEAAAVDGHVKVGPPASAPADALPGAPGVEQSIGVPDASSSAEPTVAVNPLPDVPDAPSDAPDVAHGQPDQPPYSPNDPT